MTDNTDLLLGGLLSITKQSFQFGSMLMWVCVCLLPSYLLQRAEESDGGPLVIRIESLSFHYTNNDSPSPAVENHPESMLALK